MKKIVLIGAILSCLLFSGCTQQEMTRDFGGSMEIELEPNQKLMEITWKEDSLWYLTRPMTEDDKAEIYTFQQSSAWGIFEGTVTVKEIKE